MQWLIRQAEVYRAHLRAGPFFSELAYARRPADLTWVHQLRHQSREFTQALCLRYSLCRDKAYEPVFAQHAFEEIDHPDQLLAWMKTHGFLDDVAAVESVATRETLSSLAFCWRTALREPPDVQAIVLNVFSEGVALDFYTATIPVLERLNILSGRYWKVHREVDAQHLTLGLEQCGDIAADTPLGGRYQRALWHAACHYHSMLSSWVGITAALPEPQWDAPAQSQPPPLGLPAVAARQPIQTAPLE